MKKPTIYLFCRQKRVARWRLVARQKRIGKKQNNQIFKSTNNGIVIKSPNVIGILKNAKAVVDFIKKISYFVLIRKAAVSLDFRWVEALYPEGTILLFSEIDRIVSLSEINKPITIINPRIGRQREVLKQIGLLEITGDTCNVQPRRSDVVYWKSTKGANQSGENLAILEAVAEQANKENADRLAKNTIWRGVTEAVANSVEHAYLYPREVDNFQGLEESRWWMFTQLIDDSFTVTVCDLGCGYKSTIKKTIPEEFIDTLISIFVEKRLKNPDASAIFTAMEYGRSGTKKTERGKGSRDALSVVTRHGSGYLFVISNTGWVRFEKNGSADVTTHGALDVNINGTILFWKLPLANKTVRNNDVN